MWRSSHSHLWLVNTIISGLCCQGKQAQPNVKEFSPCPIGNIIHKLKMPNKLSEILIIPVKYRIAGKFGRMFWHDRLCTHASCTRLVRTRELCTVGLTSSTLFAYEGLHACEMKNVSCRALAARVFCQV